MVKPTRNRRETDAGQYPFDGWVESLAPTIINVLIVRTRVRVLSLTTTDYLF